MHEVSLRLEKQVFILNPNSTYVWVKCIWIFNKAWINYIMNFKSQYGKEQYPEWFCNLCTAWINKSWSINAKLKVSYCSLKRWNSMKFHSLFYQKHSQCMWHNIIKKLCLNRWKLFLRWLIITLFFFFTYVYKWSCA